jgi:hypothetical protein
MSGKSSGSSTDTAHTRESNSQRQRTPTSETQAFLVDLVGAYSNRSDLREQLQQAAMILLVKASHDDEPGTNADPEVYSTTRWWSLRDRFSLTIFKP